LGGGKAVRARVLSMRLTLCLVLACAEASGQIALRINDGPPVQIAAADLAKLPRHTAVLNDHGKQISYEGVLLHDVLALGGVDFGKGLRGKQLSSYVAALASDDYEVVYALAELDPTVMDSGIVVADKREGQPLARMKDRGGSWRRTIYGRRALYGCCGRSMWCN
jgi:hypothetical protein